MMRAGLGGTLLAASLVALGLFGCKKQASDKQAAKVETGSATKPAETKPAPPPAPKYDTPDAKLKRFTQCWDAFNAGKDDVFRGCFAPDAVREQVDSVPALVSQGAEKIAEMAKAQRAGFPDLKVTPQLVIVSGNDIAAILHVGGTNTGDTPGMKATGKKLGLYEAEIATMNADGTFSHDSIYVDQPTMYHQLGLLDADTPDVTAPEAAEPVALVSKGDATEQANKAIVEKDVDSVNKKAAKAIAPLIADDVVLVDHGDKQKIVSKKAYLKWLGGMLGSTKDGFVDIKGIWTAGDYVAIAAVFSGTPTQAAVGKGVVPKHIETHVAQFFRIKDGKIAEQHIFGNQLETAVQLGVVDPDQLMQQLSKSTK